MEAFTLLKYWKTTTTTTLTSTSTDSGPPPLPPPAVVSDTGHGGDDDGPFFDLEFAIPADDDDNDDDNNDDDSNETTDDEHEEEDVEEVEVQPNMTFSPSDDLFFKGRILQINGSPVQETDDDVTPPAGGTTNTSSSSSSSSSIPVSLARSATKFRVFLLGLKRSKSESNPKQPPQNHSKKFFAVKFNVEEVPIFSLLTRASSNSKNNSTTSTTRDDGGEEKSEKVESGGEEKRNKREVVMQKYLKMVKPLYVKVSKKNEKEEKMVGPKQVKQQQRLNLKVIAKKHLAKSKSAVVHSMVQQQFYSNGNGNSNTNSSEKRDDSLFQQQDGIQSAILHCKRSFNSSKDFLEGEGASSKLLTQLINESLNEKKSATIQEQCNGVDENEKCMSNVTTTSVQ